MNEAHDSLNRFLETRGAQILGRSIGQFSRRIHLVVGGAMLALGVGFLAAPLLGGPPEVIAGGVGPVIAGVLNLSMATAMGRRTAVAPPGQVEYSSEARVLILQLYRERFGWSSNFGMCGLRRGSRLSQRRMNRRLAMAGMAEPLPAPTTHVLDYLERAAEAYQRVAAVLAINKAQPAVVKLGGRALMAAEEALADVFHQASTLCRYPEGLATGRASLEARISTLEEIAGRMESLVASGVEPTRSTRSSIDDFLTDLRLEELARTELRIEPESSGESVREDGAR